MFFKKVVLCLSTIRQNSIKCPRFRPFGAFCNHFQPIDAAPHYHHNLHLVSVHSHNQQTSLQNSTNHAVHKLKYPKTVNKFSNRTHTCGDLNVDSIGDNVKLYGWLKFQRMGKFFVLRDAYGCTQCIIDEKRKDLSKLLQGLSYESVLSISGIVLSRPKEQCNPNMETGNIEVLVESIEIFNLAVPHLPFFVRNYNKAKESLQMQYRYLSLRFPELQRNLRVRSWITMKMREYLVYQCGFVDIATPTLFRKTPGGAQEFVVPTRHPGKFYALVQSPQQFKQLLMIGGIDRYFQIAQCYRDEGSRSDRQPEFTQLDIEMSFVHRNDVMNIIEELILYSWPEFLDVLQTPFQRLTYEDAMEMYGTDCPDLRIPGRIYNVSPTSHKSNDSFHELHHIYATVFRGKQQFLTKSVEDKLASLYKQVFPKASLLQFNVSDTSIAELNTRFSPIVIKNINNYFNLEKGDVLLLSHGQKTDARQLLGKIRIEFANILESKGTFVRSLDYKFVWIYDFPLFTMDDCKALETTHHPFTQPHPEDAEKLLTDPLKVRGLQYDLVLNGSEIGGGSIRIHQKELQEKIFKMLNLNSSELLYFLEALGSGAPPHGGIALGLDRYISMICKTSSIREVIAFPKTMEGRDLMSGAPSFISEKDKKLYHIEISNNK